MTTAPKSKIAMIAGFGDNASMYDGLRGTALAQKYELLLLNLPGFGATALGGKTTLASLADWLAIEMERQGARIIAAHSVASIIATLATRNPKSTIDHILSLEGNLLAGDAYFSGRANEHSDPQSFLEWFTPRIAKRGESDPILARYAKEVARADPQALWELGCDAHRFSQGNHPGEMLREVPRATYFYNSENCAKASMEWLHASDLPAVELLGASHWPSIDAPEELSQAIETALG